MTASQGQPPSPRSQTSGLMKNAGKPWRLDGPWTREFDKVENWEGKPYLLAEGHRRRFGDSSTRRNASHGQNMYQHCQLKLLGSMCGIEENIWQKHCPRKQFLNRKNGTTITDPKNIVNQHAAVFTDNSSAHYSATFQAIKEQEEKVKIDFTSNNTEVYNKPFRLRDLRR